jgi:hypothetical protein
MYFVPPGLPEARLVGMGYTFFTIPNLKRADFR